MSTQGSGSQTIGPPISKPRRSDGLVARGAAAPVLPALCLLEVCVVLHTEALRCGGSEARGQSRMHVADAAETRQNAAYLLVAAEGDES